MMTFYLYQAHVWCSAPQPDLDELLQLSKDFKQNFSFFFFFKFSLILLELPLFAWL